MRLACGHLLIADTCGAGLEFVREHVAEFITERDGFPANADDIFLTAGASPAVQMTLRVLIRDATDGIMVPIPQVVLTHCPAYALSAVPKQLPHCTCVGLPGVVPFVLWHDRLVRWEFGAIRAVGRDQVGLEGLASAQAPPSTPCVHLFRWVRSRSWSLCWRRPVTVVSTSEPWW